MSVFSILAQCVPEVTADDVGPRTTYFAGVDKDTFYKWRYRVKKWKVTIPYNASSSGSGGSASASGSMSNSDVITCENSITEEIQLVCSSGFSYGYGGTDSYNDFDSSGPSNAGAYGTYFNENVNLSFGGRFYDDLYYISISTSAQLFAYGSGTVDGGPDGTTIKSDSLIVAWSPPFGSQTEEEINWIVDGQNFSSFGIKLVVDEDGGRASASASSSFGTILVEPIEYWPYNPGSGGPIYDSTDGSELRDPWSVQSW